jgi:hypothetical protein
LIIVILAVCWWPGFENSAQERVNPDIPAAITKVIGELRDAKGWNFNDEQKEWISGRNKIPYREWMRPEYRKVGKDNFHFFRFAELRYRGKPYFILIKEFTKGKYQYSSISEGWYTSTEQWYAVFPPSEWEKIKRLKDRTPNLLKIRVVYKSNVEFGRVNHREIEKKIDIDRHVKTWGKDIYFHFYAYPMKDKGLIQFYIYNTIEDIRKRKYKPYYEITLEKFNDLFGLNK